MAILIFFLQNGGHLGGATLGARKKSKQYAIGDMWVNFRAFGRMWAKRSIYYPKLPDYLRRSPWIFTQAYTIGLYRDVWIAAIAWSRTSLETNLVVTCTTSQCKLRSLRANSGMVHITTKWISSLTLDYNGVFAIKTYSGLRTISGRWIYFPCRVKACV